MGDIDSCLLFVKPGRSAGSCGYSSDHIIHGSYLLRSHITSLFNVMISHGFAPMDFRLSTLIPIHKKKRKSRNDSDNYRAIALSSILGKMLIIFCWLNMMMFLIRQICNMGLKRSTEQLNVHLL